MTTIYSALNPTGERVLLPVGKCYGKDGQIVDLAQPGFRKLDEVTTAGGIRFATAIDSTAAEGLLEIGREGDDPRYRTVFLTATEFRAISELCEQAARKLDEAMEARDA